MKRTLGWLVALLLFTFSLAPALAQEEAASAASWIGSQINADGGFSDGFSEESSASATADAVLAGASAGVGVATWGAEASPLDYLAAQAGALPTTGVTAKTVLAALATGLDPRAFGGTDLIEQLGAAYDEESGLFTGTVTDHALAMLALHAAGEAVAPEATDALVALQADDGGWSFDGTSQPDTNTTSVAMQALAAVGEPSDSEPVAAALEYLRGQQNEDGGFPYQNPSDFGTESDANSTAWVIQALLASGEELADWNDPQAFLVSLQGEDGSLQWKSDVPGANFLATVQAVPALASVTLVGLPVVEASTLPAAEDESSEETAEEEPATMPGSGGQPLWPAIATVGGALFLLEGLRRRRAA